MEKTPKIEVGEWADTRFVDEVLKEIGTYANLDPPGRALRIGLTGIQKGFMRIYPKRVTPECFNRGSSPSFVWIPALRDPQGREHRRTAKNMRE